MRFRSIILFLLVLFLGLSGCAYYNTFYNAKKFYRLASKDREKRLRSQTHQQRTKTRGASRTSAAARSYDMDRPSTQEMQNYAKAIEKASAVLNYYPKSKYVDDALMLLGRCFFYRREFPKAKRKFDELIGIYPNSEFIPDARLLLAKTYVEMEDFAHAEEMLTVMIYEEGLKREIVEEAQNALGDLYYRQERYTMAAEAYRTAVKNSRDKQNRSLALYRLGDCLIEMQEYDEVPDILKDAVKESPNEEFKSQAMYRLGEAQRLVHDYDGAIKTFSKLMAEEMNVNRLPMVKFQLAESIRLKGEIDDAIKWYETIIEDHKRTDASARSYFSLGEIQEKLEMDFKAAKVSYDKVRGEFANSEVAPEARIRSENIGTMLELENTLAKLEGRAVDEDSTGAALGADQLARAGSTKDDARIDVGGDGMWLYYIGRMRPPPRSLTDLSLADRKRSAIEQQMKAVALGDSASNDSLAAIANLDSVVIDEDELAKMELQKKLDIANTRLQLAELFLLRFDMVDSALALYMEIMEDKPDTSVTAKALYSVAYIFDTIKGDSVTADSLYSSLINMYPETEQADGARKALGYEIEMKVDSAAIAYRDAEQALWSGADNDSILFLLEDIINDYPESEFSRKAAYAEGWVYENRLGNPDSALAIYRRLVADFPKSEYVKIVKPKIDAVEQFKKEQEARRKAIADSIAAAQQAAQDSSAAVQDSTAAVMDSTKAVAPDSLRASMVGDSLGQSNDSLATPLGRVAKKSPVGATNGKKIQSDTTNKTVPVLPDSTKKPLTIQQSSATPAKDIPSTQTQRDSLDQNESKSDSLKKLGVAKPQEKNKKSNQTNERRPGDKKIIRTP